MMNDVQEIRDDEIRVLGIRAEEDHTAPGRDGGKQGCMWMSVLMTMLVCVAASCMIWYLDRQIEDELVANRIAGEAEPSFFEPENSLGKPTVLYSVAVVGEANRPYTEMVDTMINDIPLRIYIPHNAVMSLHKGYLDIDDPTIVYVAQAADIRADNGQIVGDFVLNGVSLVNSVSKLGYCACVEGEVFIGMARNTDLLDMAVQTGGYFFRQYPLVYNGMLVENEPKLKSIRRSICKRRGQVFMVETLSRESFHDFAQSLVDLGVDDAVYLVGSSTYGWAVDRDGQKYEFGDKALYLDGNILPPNINYIVWR